MLILININQSVALQSGASCSLCMSHSDVLLGELESESDPACQTGMERIFTGMERPSGSLLPLLPRTAWLGAENRMV